MLTFRFYDKDPNEILDIVVKLRSDGYVQGTDFDFKFHPSRWDNFSYEPIVEKHVEFIFYNDKKATMFALKWGAK